jgi:predicted phosphodiesterase
MTILRICSDLHLEAFSGRDVSTLAIDFLPADEQDANSILILAGDISSNPTQLLAFLGVIESRFKKVLYIPGNHEYYRQNYDAWNPEMADRFDLHLRNTVYALGTVGYYEIDDVRFIFSTLWGDGGPTLADQGQVGWYLNDFRIIERDDHSEHMFGAARRKFKVQDMIDLHKEQKARIVEYLKQPFAGRSVVVSHHLPSRRLVSPRFWPQDGSDGANGGFASNCDDILAYDHAPDLWVHGHTHDAIDTKLWKTRVVCNPTGYRGEWENGFSGGRGSKLFVEV